MNRIPVTILEEDCRDRAEIAARSLNKPRARRAAVLLLSAYGLNAKEISELIGCDRKAVSDTAAEYRETKDIQSVLRSSKPGRKRKVSNKDIFARSAKACAANDNLNAFQAIELERGEQRRIARELGVHESTVARTRDVTDPKGPERYDPMKGWSGRQRYTIPGPILKAWTTSPFFRYPSRYALREATESVLVASRSTTKERTDNWTPWMRIRDFTAQSPTRQAAQLMASEHAFWQDISVIVYQCWLVPDHPLANLPPHEQLVPRQIEAVDELKKGQLRDSGTNWQLLKNYIPSDIINTTKAIKLLGRTQVPSGFICSRVASAAIRQWESVFAEPIRVLVVWLQEIGMKPETREGTGRPPKQLPMKPEGSPPWSYDPFIRDDIFRQFIARYESASARSEG